MGVIAIIAAMLVGDIHAILAVVLRRSRSTATTSRFLVEMMRLVQRWYSPALSEP